MLIALPTTDDKTSACPSPPQSKETEHPTCSLGHMEQNNKKQPRPNKATKKHHATMAATFFNRYLIPAKRHPVDHVYEKITHQTDRRIGAALRHRPYSRLTKNR